MVSLSGVAFFWRRRRVLSEAGHLAASLMPHVWHDSEAANVDHGQVVGPRVEDVAFLVDLDDLAPVGGWAAGRRDGPPCERRSSRYQQPTPRPRRHLTGSRFHQQIATSPAESATTAATLFSGGHNLATPTMSPRYATSTGQLSHVLGRPHPQPSRLAGNQ